MIKIRGVVLAAYTDLRNRVLDSIYRRFPSEEGDLGIELRNDVIDLTNYVIVRFDTFNTWVGQSVFGGVGAFLLLILLSLGVGFGQIILSFLPIFPEWIIVIPAGIFGLIFLGFTVIFIGLANLMIILYAGAIIRFGLQRIRDSLNPEEIGSTQMYYQVFPESEESPDTVRIYAVNAHSFSRSIFYSLLALAIFIFAAISPILSSIFAELLKLITSRRITASYQKEVTDFFQSADAVLPFDLESLLAAGSLFDLAIISVVFLAFLIFLNIKHIAQLSSYSQLAESEIDEFIFTEEWAKYKLMVKVILHQLVFGDLRNQYELTRGKIADALLAILLGTSAGYGLLFLYVEAFTT